MASDLRAALRPALVLLLLFSALLGLAYPLVVLGIGQVILPEQANGSLIRERGKVVGSALIGQSFAAAGYFHGRPSAAGKNGYDAKASSGSNLGPASKALIDATRAAVKAVAADTRGAAVPADMATASGSGLDPDISPDNALLQVDRVAAARHVPAARVKALVDAATELPLAGLLGEPHVNVLLLNRQLDAAAPKPAG